MAAYLNKLTVEADEYRQFGLKCPIAVIPNGVTVTSMAPSDAFEEEFPEVLGKRIILFLARIHKKKGVTELVEAWCNVARRFNDAHLVVAGPDPVGLCCQAFGFWRSRGE